jgi:hypothetical protein
LKLPRLGCTKPNKPPLSSVKGKLNEPPLMRRFA